MRRVLLSVLVVVLATAGALVFVLRRPGPPPFPCVATSREGGLTAVGAGLLLRVEWAPEGGRFALGPEHDPVHWKAVAPAEARRLTEEVLEPISRPSRGQRAGVASIFVTCDGKGEAWRAIAAPKSWKECVEPSFSETRLQCLRRVFAAVPSAEVAAGGVSQRLADLAVAQGLASAPDDSPSLRVPSFLPFHAAPAE